MAVAPSYNFKYIWLICLIAAGGGFLFGSDWVITGGAKPFYEAYFNVTTPAMSGWAMSSALAGCIIGALFAGVLSDRFGRKRPLIGAGAILIVASIGTALADSFMTFNFYRMLGGISIGLVSTISPMFIAEISPAEQRGKFVAINQLNIVIGILLAQLVNLVIAEPVTAGATINEIKNSWNGQEGWRYMFGIELIPAMIFFIFMLIVPESPRWLTKMGQATAAHRVLCRIGSKSYAKNTLADIEATLSQESLRTEFKELASPAILPIVIIGVVLAVFQQWCGINIIFNYAQDVFKAAGFDINDTLKSIVATGSVNLIFTLIALPLVDRLGRRKLMLVGSGALIVIFFLMGTAYATHYIGLPVLLLVLAGIAIYAMTLAPVTWVLLSEIFPNRVRGIAMSTATLALWISTFALTYTFPMIDHSLGASGSFWMFSLICLVGFIFIWRRVPETKGRSLEELEHILSSPLSPPCSQTKNMLKHPNPN